jgi:hypothetical protein
MNEKCEHLIGAKPDLTRCNDLATETVTHDGKQKHVCRHHFVIHEQSHSHFDVYGVDDGQDYYGDTTSENEITIDEDDSE